MTATAGTHETDGDEPIQILHVDDDPAFADLAASFLERDEDRLTVQTATSAEEGVTLLAESDIDGIISDYDMPGQNGIEFLETVREKHPDVPFILFTGKGSEEVASDAISAGVTDYLQKGAGTEQYELLANRVVNAVERYRAQREATQTRERLQAITDNSVDAIITVDTDGRIRFANSAVEDHFGYTPSELHGDRLTTIMPGRHAETYRSTFERYIETGERSIDWANVEVAGQHKDGTELPLSIAFGEFEYEGSRRFVGILRDITEQKSREEKLRRFRKAAEAAGHAIYFTDPSGVIEYVNPAFEETTGYSAAEAIGKTPRILQSGEHDEDFYEGLWETILSGDVWRNEIINETKSGEQYVVDQTIAPLEGENGEITQFIAINIDITEQHEFEETIIRQNERLETFVGTVSHDLRGPLGVAEGQIELAQKECNSEHLRKAERALDRGETLLEELLTLAQQGETVSDVDRVDLAALAESCWRTIETANATLVAESEQSIQAAESRLKELLENLYQNAITHGGADVTIRVGELVDGFYVEDDGDGIPPADHEQVFEAGYSTAPEGTGFGLRIVKEIADAHGWSVRVTEGSDGGARFEVTGVEFAAE
jgi:PAS domain S-box-containing protein